MNRVDRRRLGMPWLCVTRATEGSKAARLAGFHGGQAVHDVFEVFAWIDAEPAGIHRYGVEDGAF